MLPYFVMMPQLMGGLLQNQPGKFVWKSDVKKVTGQIKWSEKEEKMTMEKIEENRATQEYLHTEVTEIISNTNQDGSTATTQSGSKMTVLNILEISKPMPHVLMPTVHLITGTNVLSKNMTLVPESTIVITKDIMTTITILTSSVIITMGMVTLMVVPLLLICLADTIQMIPSSPLKKPMKDGKTINTKRSAEFLVHIPLFRADCFLMAVQMRSDVTWKPVNGRMVKDLGDAMNHSVGDINASIPTEMSTEPGIVQDHTQNMQKTEQMASSVSGAEVLPMKLKVKTMTKMMNVI